VRQAALVRLGRLSSTSKKRTGRARAHKLAQDKDSDVRKAAAGAIVSAFQYHKDKEQLTRVISLAQDKDSVVRQAAAVRLSAFQSSKQRTG
jgi:HEAT repeat protein